MHPDQLNELLTIRQLDGWAAYASMEPFGQPYDELLHGIRSMLVASIWPREGTPPEPADFMPALQASEPVEQDPRVMVDNLRAAKAISAAAAQRGKKKK